LLRVASLAIVAAVSVGNLATTACRILPIRAGSPPAASEVAREALRFGPARRALDIREVAGTIGFIGDLPAEQMGSEDQATEDYYIAQYWLAPVVLDSGSDSWDWAIASLRAKAPAARLPGGWRIEATSGSGVYLLRKGRP
jgi:hypothetical protein